MTHPITAKRTQTSPLFRLFTFIICAHISILCVLFSFVIRAAGVNRRGHGIKYQMTANGDQLHDSDAQNIHHESTILTIQQKAPHPIRLGSAIFRVSCVRPGFLALLCAPFWCWSFRWRQMDSARLRFYHSAIFYFNIYLPLPFSSAHNQFNENEIFSAHLNINGPPTSARAFLGCLDSWLNSNKLHVLFSVWLSTARNERQQFGVVAIRDYHISAVS